MRNVLVILFSCIFCLGDGYDLTDFLANTTQTFNVIKIKRSASFYYNITSIGLDCEFSNTYSHSWKVYSADVGANASLMWNDPSFLISTSSFTLSRDNHTMFIPCCLVQYGLLRVVAEVLMTGHSNAVGFKSRRVFSVNVDQSDLSVALLEEQTHKVFPYNIMVSICSSRICYYL